MYKLHAYLVHMKSYEGAFDLLIYEKYTSKPNTII